MKRSANLARTAVIALLAAVGPALGASGCAGPAALRDAPPSACECDALPAPDPRVPWARTWRDIRYSPDGQAVALVGLRPYFLQLMRDRNAGSADPRDGTPESDALIQGGVSVLAWRPDGTTGHFVAPYEDYHEDEAGAWSADSRYYAKVMTKDQDIELVLLNIGDGSWRRAATIDRWHTSPPTWNPLAPEVAVVESWTTSSGRYRKAIGDPLTLSDPLLAAHLALESRHGEQAQVVEPAIPLARVLVASPQAGLIRERTLDVFPDDVMCMRLSWSPDGRFLLLSTWKQYWGNCELRLLDAATLAVLDTWTGASCWHDAAPAWSPDGRRFAMASTSVTIVGVSADGRFESPQSHESPEPIRQMAWCPSGERLLLFCSQEAPDVVEFFDGISRMGENVPHRRTYSVWFFDPSSGKATECEDLRITNRGVNWNDAWMIPRAAEAFARWSR